MLYELHNLMKQFGPRRVLDIEYLALEPGQVFALIGPNGAGKTTLLNHLAFLDQPTSGEILFRGQPVSMEQAEVTRLRRRVVLVDQNPILFSGSVWSNIEFGLKIRQFSRKQRQSRVEHALDQVGMLGFARAGVHGLSGGEVKRVAFARALALEPEVLLCDEPTANVDREHQEVIMRIIAHANSLKHTSIIFSTHYLSQSRRLAHRTIILQDGKLSEQPEHNVFTGWLVRRADGVYVRLADRHEIKITEKGPTPGIIGRSVQMHIPAERIQVVPERTAEDGLIGGVVVEITMENGTVRLVVDIGVPLQVSLERERYARDPIYAGQEVGVDIPQDAAYLLGQEG